MKDEQLQACRALIDFARTHAEEVYGDNEEENKGCTENVKAILEDAKTLEDYLDGE